MTAPAHGLQALFELKKHSALVKQAMLHLPSWITPNGVTITRMLLAIPVAALLHLDFMLAALLLGVFTELLDFIDGALAEVRNQKSELGAFLDPLADKVFHCSILLGLLHRLPTPFGFAVALIIAYALALTLVRIVKWWKSLAVAATADGKLKLILESGTLAILITGLLIDSSALVFAGGCLLFVLPIFAAKSLVSQLEVFWPEER